MYSALVDAVEIEFLIEEKRTELFAKITEGGYSSADALPLSEFLVQKIDSLDDGFAFQVIHNNNILYYYAFKHKEYVLCPACLCHLFGLEDYSCLVVKNIIEYYYIILKSGPNDPLSLISEYFLKLLQSFNFIPPTDENKILRLEPENKDTVMIFNRENPGKIPHRLFMKFINGTPISDPLYISEENSNYIYIRRDVKFDLKAKYGDLYNCAESYGHILLHACSAAARKAKEIIDLINADERLMLTSLTNAFKNTDYLRESYTLDKLINLIRENYESGKRFKDSSYNSCMFGIFQSSGYGKSKLIELLGTKIPTFYSSCQHRLSYPKPSVYLRMLFEKLQTIIEAASYKKCCFLNNIATATYIYILRVMYIILIKKKRDTQNLCQFLDIDEELKTTTLLPEFPNQSTKEQEESVFNILFKNLEEICLYNESINYCGRQLISLGELRCWKSENPLQLTNDPNKFSFDENANSPEDGLTNNLEKDVMKLLEEFQTDKSLPWVFVVDEAQGLLYENSETSQVPFSWILRDIDFGRHSLEENIHDQSPYNVFRRVFRIFSGPWERLMLILVSSCRKVIIPNKGNKMDLSSRSYSPKFLKNFIPIQSYNVNSTVIQEIEADMFQKKIYQLRGEEPIKDWNEFLESNFRLIEYFKFGRPLTYGIFKDLEEKNVISNSYNLEAAFRECCEFKYLGKKLSGGMGYLNDEISDIHCLFSMFNFAFGTNYLPSFLSRDELVRDHMMTVVKYTFEKNPQIIEQMEISWEEKNDKEICYLSGGFLPEGAINLLSARYFAKFPRSLSKILNICLRNGICNVKSYAELLAQFFALSAIFLHINFSLEQVRKLAFQSTYLQDFLMKLGEGSIGIRLLRSNSFLFNARMSFGYFEHCSKNPLKKPFDLMARCLFRGSSLTLNQSFSALNLMFPLVLEDGRISFVGIKTIYEKECYIEEIVQRAVEKMNFYKMFGYHSDRPFVIIILILCDSNPQIHIEKPSLNVQNPLDHPNIIILKGISQAIREHTGLFEITPMGIMYGGIDEGYLEYSDHLQGLSREFP
jgi:hypothetical protein